MGQLIEMSLRGSMMIFMILLLRKVLYKRIKPNFLYSIWFIVIIALCNPFVPQSSVSIYNVMNQVTTKISTAQISRNPLSTPREKTNVVTPDGKVQEQQTLPFQPESSAKVPVKLESSQLLLKSYILITMCLLGIILVSYLGLWIRLKREKGTFDRANLILKRYKVDKLIKVKITDQVKMPGIVGVIKPTILIPAWTLENMSDEDMEMILLHEISHYRRGDTFMTWVMTIIKVFHWFNPIVWLGLHAMREDMELACDARVLSILQEGKEKAYGNMLINLIEDFGQKHRGLILYPQLNSEKKQLWRRIVMIKNKKLYSGIIAGCVCVVLVVAGTLFLTKPNEVSGNGAKPVAIEESSSLPTEELVVQNVKATDASFSYIVKEVKKVKEEGTYVTYQLKANVLDVYNGNLKVDDLITVEKTIEKNQPVYEVNTVIVGSYNKGEGGIYRTPDVGYDFPNSNYTDLNTLFLNAQIELSLSKDFIKANMAQGEASVVLKIKDITKASEEGNYTNYLYKTTVVKSFKGDLKEGDQVVLRKFVESATAPLNVGDQIIGTFTQNEEGQWLTPDVGYDFPHTLGIEKIFEEAAK